MFSFLLSQLNLVHIGVVNLINSLVQYTVYIQVKLVLTIIIIKNYIHDNSIE